MGKGERRKGYGWGREERMSSRRSRGEVVDNRRGREWMEKGVRVGGRKDIMMDTGERVSG